MKCRKCGTNNLDGSKFCYNCGTNLLQNSESFIEQDPIEAGATNIKNGCVDIDVEKATVLPAKTKDGEDNTAVETSRERNDAACPYCKAKECQPLQKTTVESEHRGYHWDSGCCGMFLLGPFGLLCGLCGTGTKTKMDNELWWTCTKCGKQHLALADALRKWDTAVSGLPMTGLGAGIAILILRYIISTGFLTSALITAGVVYMLYEGVSEVKKQLSEALGEPIAQYLDQERQENEKLMFRLAVGIAVIVGLCGVQILDMILG